MADVVIGLDLGTGGVRAIVVDLRGIFIALPAQAVEDFNIRLANLEIRALDLSDGNQQKLLLARAYLVANGTTLINRNLILLG